MRKIADIIAMNPAPTRNINRGTRTDGVAIKDEGIEICEFSGKRKAAKPIVAHPMTDEQRQEIMRRQAEGVRAMSKEEMARRQLETADGARNAWPSADYARGQASMNNFWREAADAMTIAQLPPKPQPTLWARFKRWIRA